MSHARVEEISDTDSDPDIMDPSALVGPSSSRNAPNDSLMAPEFIPSAATQPRPQQPPAASKTWHVLYPVYFDASVTRVQGRRIAKELAVKNPLALTIANAVSQRGLMSVFEPIRTHPKDWANPGRVRVRLKDEEGRWVARGVKNSMSSHVD
jgi:signal recognition particle subunit SRP19